ncbi:CAP domain-containing protein [Bradyrhizobium sp. 135]|uniref:CAP domain-containing protein n=1 Tax=Bradyrhizobium sp. 135 TaxID=2782612 RepID=UPI001FFA79D3|nr:CAP domain-containing protein [Bradyrhizobium sp. 135]
MCRLSLNFLLATLLSAAAFMTFLSPAFSQNIGQAFKFAGSNVAYNGDADRFVVTMGNRIIVIRRDGGVFGHDVTGNTVGQAFKFAGSNVAYNGDADRFVVTMGSRIIVIRRDGGVFGHDVTGNTIGQAFKFAGSNVAYNGDADRFVVMMGNRIIVTRRDGGVFGHDVAGNTIGQAFKFAGSDVAYNGDADRFVATIGNRIIVIRRDGGVFGHDLGAGGGTQVPADWNEMLRAHNDFRRQHCSPPLQWDATLAAAAQTYAETGPLGQHGTSNENLANALSFRTNNGVSTDVLPAKTDTAAFTETWACEGKYYKYDDPRICGGFKSACDEPKPECKNNNPVTGHFTQVVWKSATKVGCGRATRKMQANDGKTHDGTNWVCRYDSGNTNDPAVLRQNVLPVGCTP